MRRGTALVTGASSGIGAELARLLAAYGWDLVLTARSVDTLERFCGQLAEEHGIRARPLPADLSVPADREALYAALAGTEIDILINNAGFGLRGPYAEIPWPEEARLIEVNIAALAHLTRLFLPGMLQRKRGRILNMASTAAFVPGPFMAAYYASKAFVRSFSEAIGEEAAGTGVTVTVLCPGPTETGFAQAAGVAGSNLFRGPVMTAAQVAREGYTAMMKGQREAIAGSRNRWLMRGVPFAPRRMLAKFTRRLNSS